MADPPMTQIDEMLGRQARDVVVGGDVDVRQVRFVRSCEHNGHDDRRAFDGGTGVGGSYHHQAVDPLRQQSLDGVPADALIEVAVGKYRCDSDGVERGGQTLEQTSRTMLARAVDVVQYADARGIVAMVDFNRRFDRDYAELQRVVAAGEVGTVHLIQMTTRGPVMPPLEYIAVSGGQMRDQTVHFFDLARWISGLDPEAVFATGSTLVEPAPDCGDVDTSVVTLRLPGGALVQIDSARQIGYGYDERIEVLGSTGMVEARRHRTGCVSRYNAGRIVDDGMHAGWFERIAASYRSALDHFVDALERGSPVGPTLSERSRRRPSPRRIAVTRQQGDGGDRVPGPDDADCEFLPATRRSPALKRTIVGV